LLFTEAQAEHFPLQQMPVPASPHAVAGLSATDARLTHCCDPMEQSVTPVWQPSGVAHRLPPMHGTQFPLPSQTPLCWEGVVQFVPGFWGLFVSVHTMPPVHESDPMLQGLFGGGQGAAFTHCLHWPVEQTIPAPQGVPSVALPICVQTGAPVEQESFATLHGPASLQS
jgi:hypothetical protein